MDSFWANLGFLALLTLIVLGYRAFLRHEEDNGAALTRRQQLKRAARAFANGAPGAEVLRLLNSCEGLDEAQADYIAETAAPLHQDKDGGYRAFLRLAEREMSGGGCVERRHAG